MEVDERKLHKRQIQDIDGFCKVAAIDQTKGHGYSRTLGDMWVLVEKEEEGVDFYERLEELNEELEQLNLEAKEPEDRIAENIEKIID